MNSDETPKIKINKKRNIASIPKGPADVGVVMFNSDTSKQRLATLAIDIIDFRILFSLYPLC